MSAATVYSFPTSSHRHELILMSPAEVIQAFHRGTDALINIEGIGDGGQWQMFASATAAELFKSSTLPDVLNGPGIYFSLASVYRSQRRAKGGMVSASFVSPVTGHECFKRERGLQWLNTVSVDIDAHGGPFDFDSAVQEALRYTLAAGLPFPSIVCNSGRGLWLHWLLTDRPEWNARQGRAVNHPPGAYSNLRGLHSRILRAAVQAYKGLRQGTADSACTDSQRVARFPGSMNAASGTRCQYYRASDRKYTLPEMAEAFGVHALKTSLERDHVNATECTGQKSCKCSGQRWNEKTGKALKPVCLSLLRSAGRARWLRPLSGLRQLAEIRGKFSQGTRHKAVYLFAVLARRNCLPDLQGQTERFAASYCPAMSAAAVRKCVRSANKNTGRIRNAVIVDWLKITDTELSQITGWIKPARAPKGTRKTAIAARREILSNELKLNPKCSIRRAVFLLAQAGFCLKRSQVAEYLRSLRRDDVSPLSTSSEGQDRKNPVSVLICIQGSKGHKRSNTGTSTETGHPHQHIGQDKKLAATIGIKTVMSEVLDMENI